MKKQKEIPVLGVIPARYGSTRFPGKPLVLLGNRRLIEWSYRAAKKALKNVVVATDDRKIEGAVTRFGGQALLTSKRHKTGGDRIQEVARKRKARIYVNVQGDEPFLNPKAIQKTYQLAKARQKVSTLAVPISAKEAQNPNVVKVVFDRNGRALYFSRSPIPSASRSKPARYYKHIGLYAYPREILLKFARWPQTALEKIEKLEQLRLLEMGEPIFVAITQKDSIGIDTRADLEKAKRILRRGRASRA